MELEPYFVKALKLLHSRHPDSSEQLRQMLFDVLVQKKVKTEIKEEDDTKDKSKASHRSKESSETKKREVEKRNLDKDWSMSFWDFMEIQVEEYFRVNHSPLKQELSDLGGAPESKKPKLEPSVSPAHKPGTPEHRSEKEREKESHKHKDKDKSKDHKSKDKDKHDRSKDREREKEKEKQREKERKVQEMLKAKKIMSSEDSSSESDNEQTQAKLDTDNFAMDMGIACVVCKKFDVQSGNQLVECQECHNLYHQECHKPPVTEKDVNDPRFVWYCTKCTKNMKKVVAKPHKTKSSSSQSTKEVVHESTFLKPQKAIEGSSSLQPFKRLDTSKTSSGKETPGPFIGLAGLAANFGHKPDPKNNSGKSSSSSVKLDPSKSGLAALASAASGKSSSSSTKSSSATGSSSSSSGSGSKNSMSIMSAEKRMQSMKKKAASKVQDKKNAFK